MHRLILFLASAVLAAGTAAGIRAPVNETARAVAAAALRKNMSMGHANVNRTRVNGTQLSTEKLIHARNYTFNPSKGRDPTSYTQKRLNMTSRVHHRGSRNLDPVDCCEGGWEGAFDTGMSLYINAMLGYEDAAAALSLPWVGDGIMVRVSFCMRV